MGATKGWMYKFPENLGGGFAYDCIGTSEQDLEEKAAKKYNDPPDRYRKMGLVPTLVHFVADAEMKKTAKGGARK